MLLCGIDIGTTNTKALLCDTQGAILARANVSAARPDAAGRLAPHAWSAAVENILARLADAHPLTGESILCSLAVQGGSFVTLDAVGRPTDRPTSWLALASEAAVADVRSAFADDEFYHATGWTIDAWLVASKLHDRRRAIGSALKKDESLATVPAAVLSALGGPAITDITDAQITGLFDIHRAAWWPKMLHTLGIDADQLPHVESTSRVLCENLHLAGARVSFTTSLHDQYAAMRACALDNRRVQLATGSAWVVNRRSSQFLTDASRQIHPGCDLDAGFGAIATLGPVGKHFDAVLADLNLTYADLPAISADVIAHRLPSFAIDLHRLADIASPAERLCRFVEFHAARLAYLFDTIGLPRTGSTLTMTGGATAGTIWPQTLADLTGMTVEVVQFDELTALGAVRIAHTVAIGATHAVWPAEAKVHHIDPNPSITEKYDVWLHTYQFPTFNQDTHA